MKKENKVKLPLSGNNFFDFDYIIPCEAKNPISVSEITNSCPLPPKTTIFIQIFLPKSGFFHIKLAIKSCGKISGAYILRGIRKKLALKQSQELYLFLENNMVLSNHCWYCKTVELKCVGDRMFGGKTVVKDLNVCVSALYSNTNGLTKNKIESIKQESRNDKYIMGNEWNKTKSDSALVASYFGEIGFVASCHNFTYHNGMRIEVDRKKKGYGTGIVAKKSDGIKLYDSPIDSEERKFEILPTILVLSETCKVGCIVVYRSPSMTADDEIKEFYSQISRIIRKMKISDKLNGVLYIGDPNTESSSVADMCEQDAMMSQSLVSLIGSVATRAGSETQPDSCYAWFDCLNLSIEAVVIGKLHAKMDHRAIRVRFNLRKGVSKRPKFKDVSYKVRRKGVTDDEIDLKLRSELSYWQSRYKTLIYDVDGVLRDINFSDAIVDQASKDFVKVVNDVKDFAFETRVARWPKDTPEGADNLVVRMNRITSKLEELNWVINTSGTNVEVLKRYVELEEEKLELMREKVKERVELCMKHQLESCHNRNTTNLFTWTKKLLSRDGFVEVMRPKTSKVEIDNAITECDKTFTNNNYSPNLDRYKEIEPERKYCVDEWNPVGNEVDKLAKYIETKKN